MGDSPLKISSFLAKAFFQKGPKVEKDNPNAPPI
jgi:hypothetical protein